MHIKKAIQPLHFVMGIAFFVIEVMCYDVASIQSDQIYAGPGEQEFHQ